MLWEKAYFFSCCFLSSTELFLLKIMRANICSFGILIFFSVIEHNLIEYCSKILLFLVPVNSMVSRIPFIKDLHTAHKLIVRLVKMIYLTGVPLRLCTRLISLLLDFLALLLTFLTSEKWNYYCAIFFCFFSFAFFNTIYNYIIIYFVYYFYWNVPLRLLVMMLHVKICFHILP